MTNDGSLQLLDFLLLDAVKRTGTFQDAAMAKRLHCPRSLLLERLERLLTAVYLAPSGEGYQLTEKGLRAWFPLDNCRLAAESAARETEVFDWTEVYVPESGWMEV